MDDLLAGGAGGRQSVHACRGHGMRAIGTATSHKDKPHITRPGGSGHVSAQAESGKQVQWFINA